MCYSGCVHWQLLKIRGAAHFWAYLHHISNDFNHLDLVCAAQSSTFAALLCFKTMPTFRSLVNTCKPYIYVPCSFRLTLTMVLILWCSYSILCSPFSLLSPWTDTVVILEGGALWMAKDSSCVWQWIPLFTCKDKRDDRLGLRPQEQHMWWDLDVECLSYRIPKDLLVGVHCNQSI